MFEGEYEHSLDEKNRVVLPAGLRKGMPEQTLQEGFKIVIGTNQRCLKFYCAQDWTTEVQRLRNRYGWDSEEAEDYFRDILPTVSDVQLDRQYRFVIPEARKTQAKIDRDLVFIGMWDWIEIWDKKSWEERKKERAGKQAPPPVRGVSPSGGPAG